MTLPGPVNTADFYLQALLKQAEETNTLLRSILANQEGTEEEPEPDAQGRVAVNVKEPAAKAAPRAASKKG